MDKFRFYVVELPGGRYSVQTGLFDGSTVLPLEFDDTDRDEAELACDAANAALKVAGLFDNINKG